MPSADDTVLVHPEHINVLIWAGLWLGQAQGVTLQWSTCTEQGQWVTKYLTPQTADSVGQMLVDTNTRAVNTQYGRDDMYVFSYQPPRRHEWGIVEILKAIDYYEHQGAQNDDWPYSEAFFFCFALTAMAIQQLPGYRQAPWHITPATPPAAAINPRTTTP
ncbi:hypothetical protein QRB41_27545 [Mycobacterium avium subsp. hominissuis]|nr:hypothetical protein [Mycobacterium avium]MCA4741556.1 hypothetical protein [Mycobacterium avium subsp. hominissuis]MCA4746222.1 hypothetical protein [Mycobacterium avium subsp. hominissuis]MCA4766634.1 hypothetical protein [Mycobacterium avium subsp. hominissuis]MDO2387070.1 hypothetical protein [Mycobacterium avium subsp. hominissuis]